jgi:hypothetical protein
MRTYIIDHISCGDVESRQAEMKCLSLRCVCVGGGDFDQHGQAEIVFVADVSDWSKQAEMVFVADVCVCE